MPFRKYIYYRAVFQNATFYRKCCIFYFGLWNIPALSKPVHSRACKKALRQSLPQCLSHYFIIILIELHNIFQPCQQHLHLVILHTFILPSVPIQPAYVINNFINLFAHPQSGNQCLRLFN